MEDKTTLKNLFRVEISYNNLGANNKKAVFVSQSVHCGRRNKCLLLEGLEIISLEEFVGVPLLWASQAHHSWLYEVS